MAKSVLVLYPRYLDRLHLQKVGHQYGCTFAFEEFALGEIVRQGYAPDGSLSSSPQEFIDDIIAEAKSYDGIIGTHDYPGTLVASLCAEKWGFSFASVESIVSCQHKYYFRQKLKEEVPEATPFFSLLDQKLDSLEFPLFVKPIKSSFSRHSHIIEDEQTLVALLEKGLFDPSYLSFFNEIFERYTGQPTEANTYIAEELLVGKQVSLEGYVYNNTVTILGIIDAHMYEGTLSFDCFSYPSQLAPDIQQRMGAIARKAIRSLGLDATVFSVELVYNEQDDSISIIEVNPRISAQFADFFEHVHGVNTYEILLALTLGTEPPALRQGPYRYAVSYPLRLFEDMLVTKVPADEEIAQLLPLFPDMILQIVAQEGKLLSALQQDGHSYLYAVLNIAAHTKEELVTKKDLLLSLLSFSFSARA